MVNNADFQSQITPRSLSGGDSLYINLIKKDFPEFNLELMKSNVEKNIKNIFNYINGAPLSKEEAVLSFADSIKHKYSDMSVCNIKIHKTCISDYKKAQETATIKFQTAFQFEYQDKKRGSLTAQERYETEYTYLIKTDSLDKNKNTASLRCGYCGAPIEMVGLKICAYCGNLLEVIQDRAWYITNINIK